MTLWAIQPSVLAFLVLMPLSAVAQNPSPPPAASGSQQLLKSEELDALVSPIALYPDALLAEVLMASTYPLELASKAASRRSCVYTVIHNSCAGGLIELRQWVPNS
jgi:Protein of unknown function (DUF3300)